MRLTRGHRRPGHGHWQQDENARIRRATGHRRERRTGAEVSHRAFHELRGDGEQPEAGRHIGDGKAPVRAGQAAGQTADADDHTGGRSARSFAAAEVNNQGVPGCNDLMYSSKNFAR